MDSDDIRINIGENLGHIELPAINGSSEEIKPLLSAESEEDLGTSILFPSDPHELRPAPTALEQLLSEISKKLLKDDSFDDDQKKISSGDININGNIKLSIITGSSEEKKPLLSANSDEDLGISNLFPSNSREFVPAPAAIGESSKEILTDGEDDDPSDGSDGEDDESSDSEERCSIQRVPHRLLQVNPTAYEPDVISIGPYHYGKKHLKQMEDMKRSCFAKYVDTSKRSKLDKAMNKLKDRVLECYERPIHHRDLENGSKAFIDMMIHDGCFIVWVIRHDDYPSDIWKLGHQQGDIYYDMLLLENQLPFFLLDKLDKIMTEKSTRTQTNFSTAALTFFQDSRIWSVRRRTSDSSPLHLLDLVHQCCLPSPQGIKEHKKYLDEKCKNVVAKCCPSPQDTKRYDSIKEGPSPQDIKQHDSIVKGSSPQGRQPQQKYLEKIKEKGKNVVDKCCSLSTSLILDLVQCKCGRPSPQGIEQHKTQGSWKFIRSATELDDAGIHFSGKNVLQDQDRGLFDIKFTKRPFRFKIPMSLMHKKVLEIPTLRVTDSTEHVLRNLLAYEQFTYRQTYVLDYVIFMDNLINKDKDVQLLCTSRVIENWLGDDEVVAKMFNKLGDRLYSSEDSYYAETLDKVNKHCNGKWNKAKAKLRKDYFGSPWSYCSFFAALVLLVVTVLQTVYTLMSYYHSK